MSDSDKTFTNLPDAIKAIKLDIANKQRRLHGAMRKGLRRVMPIVRGHIPKAFGELRESLHIVEGSNGAALVVDAPHAAAVERGTRPHKPPLAPLIAWVTLRGMQGLGSSGALRRSPKVHHSAKTVAEALQSSMGRAKAGAWQQHVTRLYKVSGSPKGNLGGMESDPAVVAIAKTIQRRISERGTKPQRYMASAVPDALKFLREYVEQALRNS